jgi:hypothetical protein
VTGHMTSHASVDSHSGARPPTRGACPARRLILDTPRPRQPSWAPAGALLLATLVSSAWAQTPATPTPAACPQTNLGTSQAVSVTGSTAGGMSAWFGSCGGYSAPEATLRFTAAVTGSYAIDTVGSAFDTILYVRRGTCTGPELACNDDAVGVASAVTVFLNAGETVIIVVDGFGGESGSFDLHVTGSPMPATPTLTRTSTPTSTPTPTATPGGALAIDVNRGVGRPGGIACVPAVLTTGGMQVSATANEIGGDFGFIRSCAINPSIGPGSTPNKQLDMIPVSAGVERVSVSGPNANAIPDGLLYGCTFSIGAATPEGTYVLPNAPAASDQSGDTIAGVSGTPGQIVVTACTGDCDGNGSVSIGEVIKCVNLFLGQPLCNFANATLSCPVADASLNGSVSIGEVTQCVNRFLRGC